MLKVYCHLHCLTTAVWNGCNTNFKEPYLSSWNDVLIIMENAAGDCIDILTYIYVVALYIAKMIKYVIYF